MVNVQALLGKSMIRTEKSLRLEKIWRQLAAESASGIPHRTDFKAHQIPDLLPDFTVGKVSDVGVNVIMAGSNVIGRFSGEITGQDYMQFIQEHQRPFMLAILQQVCARPVGICMQMESEFERGYMLKLEVTFLPVFDSDGSSGYAIALSVPAPDKGATLATPFLGEPKVADWQGPLDWIDLGAGAPDVASAVGMA